VGWQDAVIGNPPFVCYQEHRGHVRRRSVAAALEQGVRLSGLASSWAATLVHASAFLRPSGRLAMVLPAELLTVGYAEPIRRWLRKRFAVVNLVIRLASTTRRSWRSGMRQRFFASVAPDKLSRIPQPRKPDVLAELDFILEAGTRSPV
jgi:hypothetical protein